METLKSVLFWLDGKKSTILAICALVLSYLVSMGVITADLGTLLQAILSVITGGAVYGTSKFGARRNIK
jgi:hypothetical protein